MNRRSFLGSVAAVGAALHTREDVIGSTSQALQPDQPNPKMRALAAARFVNTMQARSWKTTRKYLRLPELLAWETTTGFIAAHPQIDVSSFETTETLVEGFATTFHITSDHRRYTLILRDRSSAFAYQTSESGVIFEGAVSGGTAGDVAGLSPITLPEDIKRHVAEAGRSTGLTGRVSRLATAISAFFVPTLYARCWRCACIYCEGFCTSACSMCDPGTCCNLGYQDCTWCCTAYSFCTSCWQCC
jgi:hypothetical protein